MDHDPYFAGRSDGKSATSPTPLLVGWGIIYGLNLFVPLFFGLAVTEKSGRQGMTFAIFLLLGLGSWAVSTLRDAGKAVILGGGFVALTQCIPFLQVSAGAIGISVARDMGQTIGREQVGSEFGGFAATVVTGGLLITLALILGWMVQGVSASFAGWRAGRKPARKPASLEIR